RPRHPRARTMLPLLLLLLATAHGLDKLPYVPTLASPTLGGQTTTSTFVLEQPRCVFTIIPRDAVIWLVVAVPSGRWGEGGKHPGQGSLLIPVPLPSAVPSFNNSLGPGTPERSFQGFPTTAPAYMTLNTTVLNYPCPKTAGDINVLRVGSETACTGDETRPTCNGPLPGPGPYRVKFLALEGSEPVAETAWSSPIALQTARPPSSTSTAGPQRSAGMVALTAILPILLAALLAALVAMLVFAGGDACGGSSAFTKPEAVAVQRYNTHHVYDQPAARL
ncbi:UPK3L protein, partial [Crotophaga sulcirostris]|nr:UPK3L protein [Crotophaga sulcirostris]